MINSAKIPRAYSEVYSFLNVLGNYYINKIPDAIYDTIKENRDKSYTPIYDKNENITQNSISQEGLALISALNLQYWCNDEEEKTKLKEIYINNDKIENEKYSYDNLFKNNSKQEASTQTDIVEYKESFFRKIVNNIKKFFMLK
ncbi:MAG: hypothetical protein K1W33_08025 [Clostridia bacterium]|nr:hypothetical protein [Clostridia bacterium]